MGFSVTSLKNLVSRHLHYHWPIQKWRLKYHEDSKHKHSKCIQGFFKTKDIRKVNFFIEVIRNSDFFKPINTEDKRGIKPNILYSFSIYFSKILEIYEILVLSQWDLWDDNKTTKILLHCSISAKGRCGWISLYWTTNISKFDN